MKNVLFLLLVLFGANSLRAQTETADRSLSPYFLVLSKTGSTTEALPLRATEAQVNIAGVIADVTVTQMYVNRGKTPLEAIYVFPASTNAAVYGLRMVVADRCIIAKIKERNQARQEYEQAKSDGKRASLLEQERPNVFQMNVANIMPGDTIRVSLQYTELLTPEAGNYAFVFPTVVGPRYTNGMSADNDGFTAMPYQHKGELPDYEFRLNIHLAAGMPLQDVHCPTHKIQVFRPDGTSADIRLDGSEKHGGNRDFILNYNLKDNEIATGLLLYDGGDEQFFLCMAQPPKRIEKDGIPPRDYVFVVDVSGSMNGFPLGISKKLLENLIQNLRSTDQFNVILFAGTSNILSEKSLPATAENVQKAIAFIDRQEGSGSTELLPALQRALQLPRNSEGLSRSIVVVTDGYIDVEKESFDLVRNNLNQANLFAFGIGSSVNRYLIEGLAHAGQGLPFVVTEEAGAAAVSEKFRRYIANPVFTQITTKFKQFEAYDIEPLSIPDVMADRPVVIFGKWRGEAKGTIQLDGYTGKNRKKSLRFDVSDVQPDKRNAALRYLWARERIRNLSDYGSSDAKQIAAITSLGLTYNLLTAYTSFVAIEEKVVNKNSADLKTVKQALPLPVGVSDLAVGFDLGIEGISGLVAVEKGGPDAAMLLWLAAFLGAAVLLWRIGRRRFGWLPVVLLGLGLSAGSCSDTVTNSESDNITFLLGDDRSNRNPYFSKAKFYFDNNKTEKTDLQVGTCVSIADVRKYLSQHPPRMGPWRRINLVVHGNEWTGMNVPVSREGTRTTAAELKNAFESGEFRTLPKNVTDAETRISVYGCNLGRDTDLLQALSQAFGSKGARYPVVRSSRYFNIFETVEQDSVLRYLADYRFVALRAGEYPGNKTVVRLLSAKYPEDTIHWNTALNRLRPRFRGDSYVHYFNIPVRWTAVYNDTLSRPAAQTEAERLEWVNAQPGLALQLKSMGIAPENFRWEIQPGNYRLPDGSTKPALLAEGNTIIYCILQPLKATEDGKTAVIQPALTDERYYAATCYTAGR